MVNKITAASIETWGYRSKVRVYGFNWVVGSEEIPERQAEQFLISLKENSTAEEFLSELMEVFPGCGLNDVVKIRYPQWGALG